MTTTAISIALKYRDALCLDTTERGEYKPATITLAMEALQLGYVFNRDLTSALNGLSASEFASVSCELLDTLRKSKGAHVKHKPMYPNFPQQVAEASDIELFLNAILHYWTAGAWSPEYEVLPREYAKEQTKLTELGVIDQENFRGILGQLLSANESLSDGDKETIVWFIDNDWPDNVVVGSYKETVCFVAGELLKRGRDISGIAKTATDILRIVTALNDGDVSLSMKTKFKSLPRKTRRLLVQALEQVATEEDINRYRGKWVALFHNLHVGEYSNRLFAIAKKIRNNEKIETFNSRVQAALDDNKLGTTLELLGQRPGEFARRLDLLLRKFEGDSDLICRKFNDIANELNTRTLLQVYGHISTRGTDSEKRVAFPKGNVQKAMLLNGQKALNTKTVEKIQCSIQTTLVNRFKLNDELGKVWIDPALRDCPVPTQIRSMSEGLFQVARGTRLPFGDSTKSTLRFFVYWVGRDIDLSATFHNENFENIGRVSYTQLRSSEYQSYHSGDIIDGREGASEFIDITIDGAYASGARYVAMNVFVFTGPNFSEHEECFAGWMTRSNPNSKEIFEPTTVEQKIDIRSNSKNCIPVLFDLKERKAIWADLTTTRHTLYGGNNVESNRASIGQAIEALVDTNNKVSLYDLFKWHGEARGTIVNSRKEADIVFGWDGDVTPYDISVINSEYVV